MFVYGCVRIVVT